jgi:hypothetical protein
MKDPLKNDGVFETYTYAWFHFQMIGKHFSDKDGKVRSKLEVWNEFRKSPTILRMIVSGAYHDLLTIDKPGWKNGVLIDRRTYIRNTLGGLMMR